MSVLEQGQLHWQARAATTGEKPFTSRNGLMLQPATQGEKLGTKHVLLQLLQGSFFPDTEIANKAAIASKRRECELRSREYLCKLFLKSTKCSYDGS